MTLSIFASCLMISTFLLTPYARSQNFGFGSFRGSAQPSLFDGVDQATKQPCSLFILEFNETPQGVRAKAETSYSHQGEKPEAFQVSGVPNKAGVLSGIGTNGKDQLVLFFEPSQIELRNLKFFNLRWLHRGHFHTERCLNLQQVE